MKAATKTMTNQQRGADQHALVHGYYRVAPFTVGLHSEPFLVPGPSHRVDKLSQLWGFMGSSNIRSFYKLISGRDCQPGGLWQYVSAAARGPLQRGRGNGAAAVHFHTRSAAVAVKRGRL